jgi:hypothetical protein
VVGIDANDLELAVQQSPAKFPAALSSTEGVERSSQSQGSKGGGCVRAVRCLQDPRVDVQSRTASELSWKSWTRNHVAIPLDPIKLKGPLQRNHREPKARRLQS